MTNVAMIGVALTGIALVLGVAAPASGQTIVEYQLAKRRSVPEQITVGPDGALWFTLAAGNALGRITAGG